MRRTGLLIALAGLLSLSAVDAQAQVAREVFGAISAPAGGQSRAIGSYAKGCVEGAVQMPKDGPNWQGMRLSRDKHWGHPATIAFLERFAATVSANDNWRGLLLGDISQARGGPAVGHASHQLGLDTDIYLTEMPNRRLSDAEREEMDMPSLLKTGGLTVDDRKWRPEHLRIIRRAASQPNVERLFVHPGIKKKLCETATGDRSWLNKVRPTYGHDYHFHIRLSCPAGSVCEKQNPVPAAEGCDKSLAWWFDVALQPPPADAPPYKPKPPMQLSELPRACVALAQAPAGPMPSFAAASAMAPPVGIPSTVPRGEIPGATAFAPLAAVPIPTLRPAW